MLRALGSVLNMIELKQIQGFLIYSIKPFFMLILLSYNDNFTFLQSFYHIAHETNILYSSLTNILHNRSLQIMRCFSNIDQVPSEHVEL